MIRHILSTFFTRSFIAFSNLAIAILLSNFTGAAGRGDQSLIITLITFIIIISGVIGSSSISYLLPRHGFPALIIPSYLWVVIVIVFCFVFIPFLNLIESHYVSDVCLLSLILSFVNVNTSVLISRQRISAANYTAFTQAISIVLWLIFSFVILKNKTVNVYINALYFGYGTSFLLSTILIIPYFKGFREISLAGYRNAAKRLAVLGFYNQIAVFTQMLSFRLSYYLVNGYFGKEEVGIYSNAVSIAESVWIIGRSMATVQHSRIVNTDDPGYSLTLTSRINRINFLISIAIVIVMSFIPDAVFTWIFGNEFKGISHIIRFIGPGIIFFGFALIQGYYFSSTGRHYVNALASSGGLLITLILGFTLIPKYGTNGAAITASISYAVTAFIVFIFYRREVHKNNLKI